MSCWLWEHTDSKNLKLCIWSLKTSLQFILWMGGLSTISLDPLPQLMTGLTPSCNSNEVDLYWCTVHAKQQTLYTCTLYTCTHTRTRRGQGEVIFTYFSSGGEATVAILLASQYVKLKTMQLLNSRKRLRAENAIIRRVNITRSSFRKSPYANAKCHSWLHQKGLIAHSCYHSANCKLF